MSLRTTLVAAIALSACNPADTAPTPAPQALAPAPTAPTGPRTHRSTASFQAAFTTNPAAPAEGSAWTFTYAIAEITTHAPSDGLVFWNDMAAPGENDQLVHLRIDANLTVQRPLAGLDCRTPPAEFTLQLAAPHAGKKVGQVGFAPDFEKTVAPPCIGPDDTKPLQAWFKVPADADIKGAQFSLNLGPDRPAPTVTLLQ